MVVWLKSQNIEGRISHTNGPIGLNEITDLVMWDPNQQDNQVS